MISKGVSPGTGGGVNSGVNTFRSVPTLTPSLKVALVGSAVGWLLPLKIVRATAPTATITEAAIPSWINTLLRLSPFCCCSLRALALVRAASRCSDLVGLGVFEVIWVVYQRIWMPRRPPLRACSDGIIEVLSGTSVERIH